MNPESSHAHRRTAVVLVSVATAAIAFKGIFARFAYLDGATVAELLLLRFLIASPLFLAIAYVSAPREAGPDTDTWLGYLVAGALYFAATLCDFTAIERIGAGLSRILLFTFPVCVILMTAVRDRHAPPPRQLAMFAVVYSGLLLVILPGKAIADGERLWTGVAWGLGSAISYAGFLMTSQHLMTRIGSLRFTASYNAVVLLLVLAYAAFVDRPQDVPSRETLVWGSLIAIVCTVLPFLLLFEGIRRLGASEASLISLSGPAITVSAAWLLLDETLNVIQCAGIAIVIAGMWLLYRPAAKKPPAAGIAESG